MSVPNNPYPTEGLFERDFLAPGTAEGTRLVPAKSPTIAVLASLLPVNQQECISLGSHARHICY